MSETIKEASSRESLITLGFVYNYRKRTHFPNWRFIIRIIIIPAFQEGKLRHGFMTLTHGHTGSLPPEPMPFCFSGQEPLPLPMHRRHMLLAPIGVTLAKPTGSRGREDSGETLPLFLSQTSTGRCKQTPTQSTCTTKSSLSPRFSLGSQASTVQP